MAHTAATTMSAASTLVTLRHVPPEILEAILLNLPVKSLLRFSAVSNSWLSMIFESRFVQKHKNRAAVNGRQRLIARKFWSYYPSVDFDNSFFFRITNNPSLMAISEDPTDLICSREGNELRLRAVCDELWLVEDNNSLFLCNHSMRTHRKLPTSSYPRTSAFVYGLAYDSAADDYKVLKIAREATSPIKPELYCLKSDSWKTFSLLPRMILQERCEFANGAFHWIPIYSNQIVSFNLSTEQSAEIVLPATFLDFKQKCDVISMEVVVVRGKLCVSVNNARDWCGGFSSELWVMEEYGIEKSWTKLFDIECNRLPSSQYCCILKPLCCYDNGDILFNLSSYDRHNLELVMYTNKSAQLKRIVACDGRQIYGGFFYVESLVSPRPSGKSNEYRSSALQWRSSRSTMKILGGSCGVAG